MRVTAVVGFFSALAAVSFAAAPATNIYSLSGAGGFGFSGQPALVVGFSVSTNWINVTISMPLQDRTLGGPSSGVEGTAYLLNSIGPGTTAANQVVAPVSISGLTASFTNKTLFTGVSLTPGSYYVMILPTSPNGGGGLGGLTSSPEGINSSTVLVGTGVTDLGAGVPNAPLAAFPPATALCCGGLNLPNNLEITVSGNPGAPVVAPAPSTLILGMIAISLIGIFELRRRFRTSPLL